MEVLDGVVLKSSSCCYTHIGKPSLTSKNSSFFNSQVGFRRENGVPNSRKFILKVGNYGFEDKNHIEYYNSGISPVCGEKKGKKGWSGVSTKKKMKLLKGLVKDLSTFSDLGYGLELDCDNKEGLVADEKSTTISQAAEVLLAQLKQLRAEEEQMKKEKEGMEKCKSQDCESSSSSSESSDSECDEVVDMKCVKNKAVVQPIETKKIHTLPEQAMSEQLSPNTEQNCCNMILEMTLNKDSGIEVLNAETRNLNQSQVGSIEKKIEVCMGGKCKKSGAPALMEEFQRVVGDEGVVVGCKCMGKCKSAPNVRVLNGNVGDDSLRTPSNSLCIGVGLEDVGLIVANYFAEESKDQLLVAASVVPT